MVADPVAATLAEISDDVTMAAAALVNNRLAPSAKKTAADELAHWAPRLLAAVEAVLKHHRPVEHSRYHTIVCGICREIWPCGEVQAISRELLSEEGER